MIGYDSNELEWCNHQKPLKLKSNKEQSLKRLSSFGGYIILPFSAGNQILKPLVSIYSS